MFAYRDVPGKGKGLIARKTITKGTRFLSEEPIITIPGQITRGDMERVKRSICTQFDGLKKEQQKAFLSMLNIHPFESVEDQYLGILRTNSLPCGSEEDEKGGIFLQACHINHGCDNNAQKSWNENIKRHTVHALRDIHKGEEITVYYLGSHRNRESRQQALQTKFGFACLCHLCSLSPEQSRESDMRLDEIMRLDDLINQEGVHAIKSAPERVLRYVDRQVSLYNQQGPDNSGLPRAFFDAAQICLANGDLARGRIFAERAVSGWIISGGDDCTQVLQHAGLVDNPSKFGLYGMSKKWKATVNEIPQGLELGAFEDWLWKRDKTKGI